MATNPSGKEIPSIVAGMFYGEIMEEEVFPFPQFSESQKEMAKAMTDAIQTYAKTSIDAAKFDRDGKLPPEVLKGLGELGLCGMAVGEEYGGLGLDSTLYARIFAEIAAIDPSIGVTLGAHQSIGYKALLNEGNEEQKKKWLPKLASGECFASFCLTEPGSGSDAYSIKTKAVKNSDGTYTINGQKLWITNAGMAGFYSVFAKTDHTDAQGNKVEKISCFIVEKDMPGVSFGEKEDKMGIRASETRAVYFDNVKVPASNIIGEEGKGFKIAMNVLNTGRLSIGSGAVSGMKMILALATKQAKERKQFGDYIINYGLIQEKLAAIAANAYATECLVYMTTGKITQGMHFEHESAICKVYGSERLWDSIDKATQIAAGNAYMKEYPYERIMRDSRIHLIFEGTNEILRIFTALSGLKGPSDDLKELGKISDVSKALQDPIKSLGVLTNFAKKRITKQLTTKTLTKVHPSLERHSQKFSHSLKDFSIAVENTIMKYGKNIIGNELAQLRIANMTIELYVQLCVLSRTTSILNNKDISESDKDYVSLLTESICRDSHQTFTKNHQRLTSSYDKLTPKISKHVAERDGFGFDIIDF
ncbi:MAG: acyl-CoA dehydrogenase family protein [Bdellovibrionota bacterium]